MSENPADAFVAHLNDPGKDIGDQRFRLNVGTLCFEFLGLPRSVAEEALRRYVPFLSTAAPDHTVRVALGAKEYLPLLADRFVRFEQTSTPDGDVLVSGDFAAFRPADGAQGLLRVSDPANINAVLGAMENYLRWTIANLALPLDGFVLHSSGLVKSGKAFVFFGHSGAGKSTVTALSTDALVLSDDLVLIQRLRPGRPPRGLGGRGRASTWMAATTPFAGEFDQAKKTAGFYPVAGLYHLRKSQDVRIDSISPALAIGRVLSCCPFVSERLRKSHLLPLVEDFVTNVACGELHFRKDSTFWDAIPTTQEHG